MAKTDVIKTDFYINYLTQEEFTAAVNNNEIDADQLYLTPDSSITTVTAGSGLSGGGSSGAITLNHSNSTTAKTTLAVYPIKIDAQGHISDSGNAVTIPAITLNGTSTTSPSFYAPTTAGTSGYYLKSNGTGAPTWQQFPTIPTDTNTWRAIQVNGTQILAGTIETNALNLKAGTNISLSNSNGTVTINGPDLSNYALKSELPTDTNTATAADNILDGSNSGTQITYAPYTSRQTGLSFYTGTTAPNGTTRLNLNGYLYATKLYSNGSEVLTSYTETDPTVPSWAKASSKPTYTASEVGALSSSTTYVSTITTSAGTHSTISSKSGSVSFNIPTKTSHLTNDSGFITSDSDEKVKSSPVAATGSSTLYLAGSSTTSETTSAVGKHAALYAYMGEADTSTNGYIRLTVGNNTASGTAGARYGVLRLYGDTAYCVDIRTESSTPTGNRTIYLPSYTSTMYLTCTSTTNAVGGATTAPVYVDDTGRIQAVTSIPYSLLTGTPTITDENVKSTTVTTASTMYLTGSSSNSTTTGGVNKHASGVLYVTADNATGGHTELRLGNTTVTTTAGGKEGQIRFYGTTATYYVTLKGGAPSANRTVTLPNKTGTIALTSDIDGKIDTAGSGLSKSGTTLNHASTITAGTAGTSSATSGITLAVPYVTYNDTGHITASGTHTHTITSASSSAAGLMSSNDYTFLSSLNNAMSASTTVLYLKTDSSTTDSSLLTAIDDLGWTSDVVS